MKLNINKKLLCFMSLFLIAASPKEEIRDKKDRQPAMAACHHWVKTVNRTGLDISAEPLTMDVYCDKPDKVIVDRSAPLSEGFHSFNSGVARRHSYRSNHHRYGR